MKLKAVTTRTLPAALLAALDSSDVADAFVHGVVARHLHVSSDEFGPATHYVQMIDHSLATSDGRTGIEVTLSKVSTSDSRSPRDVLDALGATQRLYRNLIKRYLPSGAETQLFCVLALDNPIKFKGCEPSSLVELGPEMVSGEA